MKKISTLSALLLTACVTINIYFPAAAADKVADEVIKEIQGVSTQEKSEPEARANHGRLAFYYAVDRILAVIISPAHAAGEADLSIKTVQINKLYIALLIYIFNTLFYTCYIELLVFTIYIYIIT